MTDRDVTELLAGIDHPRPLPERLRTELDAELTGVTGDVARAGAPRPVPEDLRRRLEASLQATAPLPPRLDRRLTAALARPGPRLVQLAAAVAALVLLTGVLVAGTRDADDAPVATPAPTVPTPDVGSSGAGGVPGASSGGSSATGSSAASSPPPFTGGSASAGATAGSPDEAGAPPPSASPVAGGQSLGLPVVVTGDDEAIAAGFHAYLDELNRGGGIHGRPVTTVSPEDADDRAVASVNLGAAPVAGDGGALPPWVRGVLFETVHVDDTRLRGAVTSLASPLEAQARLAVRQAFPDPAPGARTAIYVDARSPWVDRVAGAFTDALRERGIAPLRVPFDANAPVFVSADAAFLSLPPASVDAWVAAASEQSSPPIGTWGVASAWDDAFAAAGARVALHVLSPYAPAPAGPELDALRAALGRPLSAAAVHGWVTAKAIAFLLFDNGGAVLGEPSFDRLTGWSSSWSPPFEVRPETRARTPEAITLVPQDDRFVADGEFERDEPPAP